MKLHRNTFYSINTLIEILIKFNSVLNVVSILRNRVAFVQSIRFLLQSTIGFRPKLVYFALACEFCFATLLDINNIIPWNELTDSNGVLVRRIMCYVHKKY